MVSSTDFDFNIYIYWMSRQEIEIKIKLSVMLSRASSKTFPILDILDEDEK